MTSKPVLLIKFLLLISVASVILNMKRRVLALLLSIAWLACNAPKKTSVEAITIDPYQFNIQKKILCENGAVVSAHPLASKIGVEILKKGGNAIDAAIATQLALAVVYPQAGNLGGGGFMVARLANGKLLALDYREMAPLHADRDMYLDEKGNVEPGKWTSCFGSSGYGRWIICFF